MSVAVLIWTIVSVIGATVAVVGAEESYGVHARIDPSRPGIKRLALHQAFRSTLRAATLLLFAVLGGLVLMDQLPRGWLAWFLIAGVSLFTLSEVIDRYHIATFRRNGNGTQGQ